MVTLLSFQVVVKLKVERYIYFGDNNCNNRSGIHLKRCQSRQGALTSIQYHLGLPRQYKGPLHPCNTI